MIFHDICNDVNYDIYDDIYNDICNSFQVSAMISWLPQCPWPFDARIFWEMAKTLENEGFILP